jgi:hypothetical protein
MRMTEKKEKIILMTKEQRIIIIPSVDNATADISINPQKGGILRTTEQTNPITKKGDSYYIIPEPIYNSRAEDYVYNFPFILNKDGSSWQEANDYLFQKAINRTQIGKNTAPLRRVASQLLDFKIFCDDRSIDYLDLSARRPSGRPNQRYYRYLIDHGSFGNDNINTRTGIVYGFYKYLSKQDDYNIDLDRVDKTMPVNITIEGRSGKFSKTVEKRSLTLRTSKEANPVDIGYVRDEGEDLRPLSNTEFDSLINILHDDKFDVDERLMCRIAMFTGARKQTILTIRMKHLNMFKEENLSPDGTYKLFAGGGGGGDIDTKFNKKQTLYFPKGLAEQIVIYSKSKFAKNRRDKFRENIGKSKSEDTMSDDDIYLFLSNQGNCHYTAKNDYRYAKTKSNATGQRTDSLCKKLLKYLPDNFPRDFTFHWLRATFGHKYYQHLMSLVEKGILKEKEVISRVQARMHHSKKETTENYLKLFLNINDRIKIQEMYESQLFEEYQDTWKD